MSYISVKDSNIPWYPEEEPPVVSRRASSSSFLAPPKIFTNDWYDPFKVLAPDSTGLSMKKRHHPRHTRGPTEDDDLGNNSLRIARSKSLPLLRSRDKPLKEGGIFTPNRVVGKADSDRSYDRRWTLPSKATSTRSLSTFSPVCKHKSKRHKDNRKTSPAAITLRRATNIFNRDTRLTFFPPPRFDSRRTSLVDSFLSTITGDAQRAKSSAGLNEAYKPTSMGSPRRRDFTSSTRPAGGEVASPAVTEVTFKPSVSVPYADPGPEPVRLRRCSTKYVTRSSVYEVIWDENDSPTSSSVSPSPTDMASAAVTRRPSAVVVQLENQLRKAVAQSHRGSADLSLDDPTRLNSRSTRRLSFQSLLNSSLSRLINEAALQNLPRSKASKSDQRMVPSWSVDEGAHQIVFDVDYTLSPNRFAVFPPLPTQDTVDTMADREAIPVESVDMRDLWATGRGHAEGYSWPHVGSTRGVSGGFHVNSAIGAISLLNSSKLAGRAKGQQQGDDTAPPLGRISETKPGD